MLQLVVVASGLILVFGGIVTLLHGSALGWLILLVGAAFAAYAVVRLVRPTR